MKILQLSPCMSEYHAVFYDDAPDNGKKEDVFYVPVPQFALIEVRRGETIATPMILPRTGPLMPASEVEGYIGSAPVEENDNKYWLRLYWEQQEEEGKVRARRSKKKTRGKVEPIEVPDEDDEDEMEDDEEEDEEDDDDDPEGEVQLSGKTR